MKETVAEHGLVRLIRRLFSLDFLNGEILQLALNLPVDLLFYFFFEANSKNCWLWIDNAFAGSFGRSRIKDTRFRLAGCADPAVDFGLPDHSRVLVDSQPQLQRLRLPRPVGSLEGRAGCNSRSCTLGFLAELEVLIEPVSVGGDISA